MGLLPMACPVCKILWPGGLCDHCLSGLLALREPVLRHEGEYLVRSLYSWRETSPQGLSWLVRSLKGQDQKLPWRQLSVWMINAFGMRRAPLLVPIPSRGQNHALGLALALGDWMGLTVIEPLLLRRDRHQKSLNALDRRQVTFARREDEFRQYTDVLLVDDVITTGSTVRAAYRALGRPQNCEVWCLMDRRPCGN